MVSPWSEYSPIRLTAEGRKMERKNAKRMGRGPYMVSHLDCLLFLREMLRDLLAYSPSAHSFVLFFFIVACGPGLRSCAKTSRT